MDIDLEEYIILVKGLTDEIKTEDIYETYSKSGEIRRIILGRGEALIFFNDEDEASSSLVYDTIGDLIIESEITTMNTLDNVVQDIDYVAKEKEQALQKQAETVNQQQKQQIKEVEAEQQDSMLYDVEIVTNTQVEQNTKEVVPEQKPQLDWVAQPEVHQPVPEVQPSQSFTPASPFKASIDPSPRADEAKITQIPTPIVETPVVNVEVPEIKQEEVVEESAGTPSVAAVATPTVEASDVPKIVPEVAPVSSVPAAVNVQATAAPSFVPCSGIPQSSDDKKEESLSSTYSATTASSAEPTNTKVIEEPVKSVATPVVAVAAPVISASASIQLPQSACPFKSCSSAEPSKESSSCSESSSTLDSVQILKALKNTTLPERAVPSQNDLFKCIGNKNFLIGLFAILIAVTFSSAL